MMMNTNVNINVYSLSYGPFGGLFAEHILGSNVNL